jgi:hypothetical protein
MPSEFAGRRKRQHREIAEMDGFDRHQLLRVLILLAIASFISSGVPQDPRWRRRFRRAAIAAFLLAVAAALVEILLWWCS